MGRATRRTDLIERTLSAVRETPDLKPQAFAATAYCQSELDGRPRGSELTRCFRFSVSGTSASVHVHANHDNEWRWQVVAGLTGAGYDQTNFENETFCRRWLRGRTEQRRELHFLEKLGPNAALRKWPKRSIDRGPCERPVSWRRFVGVIEEVRGLRVQWNEFSISFERRAEYLLSSGETRLVVTATLRAVDGVMSGREIEIFLGVSYVGSASSRRRAIARKVERELRDARYTTMTVLTTSGRSKHPTLRRKRFATPRAAARDCAQIFTRLGVLFGSH